MRASGGCLLGVSMLSLPAALAAQQAPAPAAMPAPPSVGQTGAGSTPAAPDASVPSRAYGGYRRRAATQSATGPTAPTSATAAAQAQASTPAQAQDAGAADAGDADDVVVTGRRTQPGAVIGDIPPENQLGPADIRSYGVSSISDLLTELAPQTGSVRGSGGAPVVLLDGRRIGSFSEIRDIPTEAIQRVDILPEEVALKYGYTADQRVVNIVLRRRFRAITSEAAGSVPTEGGRYTLNPQTDILSIANGKRLNVHLNYSDSSKLLESDRNIASDPSLFSIPGNVVTPAGTVYGVPAAAGTGAAGLAQFTGTAQTSTNPSAYRTLEPATSDFQFNSVYATSIGRTSATLNARIEVQDSRSEQGLATTAMTVPGASPYNPFGTPVTLDRALGGFAPLSQDTQTVTSHLGTTFNGDRGQWRYTLTGNYDRVGTRTDTDTGVDATALQAALTANTTGVNPFGPIAPGTLVGPAASSLARSTSQTETVDALVAGPIVKLPAGPLSTSVHVGGTFSTLDSDSYRFGSVADAHILRNQGNAQANIDIPIASRRNEFLSKIGDLSANVNVAVNQLSDFGTLTTLGYGANWSPIAPIRIIASVTDQDDAPSAAQLGNPVITTPGVRVFDFVTGQTVTVSQVTGGNPALGEDRRHVAKVGLTLKPSTKIDFTLTADYVATHVRNPIASFPSASEAIETAFPDRFQRLGGTLTAIDSRPVNFAASDSHVLRYGFNLSIPIKSKLQKQFEAFRAGKGPNPIAGLFPNGRPTPPQSVFGGSLFGGGRAGGGAGGRGAANGGTGATAAGATGTGTAGAVTNGGGAPAGAAAGTNSDTGAAPTTGTQGAPGAAPAGGPPGGFGGGGGPGGGGGFGGGGGGFRGGGGFGGRGGGAGGGRLQFAFYHTWYFEDTVLVRNGGPLLDALNGDVIGSGGGQPRHELEGQAGYSNNGLGIRASANYQTGTFVRGNAAATADSSLNFSSLATFDLRLFADLGQQLKFVVRHPWARGVRVTLSATNLFDQRQRVTAADGTTPISYQPDYLDPLGRTVRLSLRKQLF
ncbi:MAG: hypothetical protein ACRYFW_01550 [Janthinobacterium lividum]